MPRPIFFKAVYTKDNNHTADYLARTTAAAVIEEIGAEKVVAVLTDNAAPNKAAWKMLQQGFRSSNLTCIGCTAHWLIPMAKDMLKLDAFKDVLDETVQMIKFFKNKHRLNCRLEEAQRSLFGTFSLQTPVGTRWMSHHNALKSFIKSKTALQRVVLPRTCTRSAKVEEGRA